MHRRNQMTKSAAALRTFALLISAFVLTGAYAQSPPQSPLTVRAIAEVEQATQDRGRDATKLANADRVVSGDAVIYTLEVRNEGPTTVRRPVVTYAVPEHMIYIADSAVGPGTEVSYSIDNARSFDAPESLKIKDPDGESRLAKATEYTHIRWQLNHALKANSVAFVRFRARVK